jgi:hypothetical protein
MALALSEFSCFYIMPQGSAEHLRDEMRDHLRLKEIGLLPAEEYETAKVRILDQHSPAAQPSLARASTRPARPRDHRFNAVWPDPE